MSQESNHFPEQVKEANFFYALHDIFRTQEEREEYMQWLATLNSPLPECQDPGGECNVQW